jgi:alkylated DNA repair protein (DNA oxidative demethylase)
MQTELAFAPAAPRVEIAEGAVLLRRFARSTELLAAIAGIAEAAPFRHLQTPRGPMSVAMTSCGTWGWHSDARGYRYVDRDPQTDRPWPAMPAAFTALAARAATLGGFPNFAPDACLINRYAVGASMGAHRDFDELDLAHPIVSVSLGVPAVFLWYGASRRERPTRFTLEDGDVVVWGGPARAAYHGVRKLSPASHPATGPLRYNLTFRRAK